MKFAFERAMAEVVCEYARYESAPDHNAKYIALIRCLSWLEEARQVGRMYRERAMGDQHVLD